MKTWANTESNIEPIIWKHYAESYVITEWPKCVISIES